MFNEVKLQVYYECEMAFELLCLVKKPFKEGYGRIDGIKSLLEVTAAKVYVIPANTASVKSVLLVKIEENILSSYYYLYTVNAAGISLLEDMDSESAHMVVASKVPMLKHENSNSALKTKLVEGVETILPPTTIEEKAQK
ncbi:hypothetical protein Tco_1529455, partial [Tanacetum coccineum]